MQKFYNILVPTDLSINSTAALDYACNIAKDSGATIHLLHCIEIIPTMHNRGPKGPKATPDSLNKASKEIKKILENFPADNLNIIEVVKSGNPYDQILNYAKDGKIDLIVLATHGSGKLINSVMGPVAEKVTRYSDIPVILVKSSLLSLPKDFKQGNTAAAESWAR